MAPRAGPTAPARRASRAVGAARPTPWVLTSARSIRAACGDSPARWRALRHARPALLDLGALLRDDRDDRSPEPSAVVVLAEDVDRVRDHRRRVPDPVARSTARAGFAHGRGLHARLPRASAGRRPSEPRLPPPLRAGEPLAPRGLAQGLGRLAHRGAHVRPGPDR